MSDQHDRASHRVDWRGADLRNASMAGVVLEGADLRASDLSGANFTGANLRYVDLRGATLKGTNFQNADLYGARMQGVEAFHTDFRGANMQLANLGGAYIEGALMPPPKIEKDHTPSPSEIAQKPRPASREPTNAHDRGNDHRRSRGR